MSAGEVSENLRAHVEAAQPSASASSIADPVPVGIAGFGMTTFVLSCVNAGFFGGTAGTPMVLGLANFGINPADLLPIGGYVGITCGVAAWYIAFAHVTNATLAASSSPHGRCGDPNGRRGSPSATSLAMNERHPEPRSLR